MGAWPLDAHSLRYLRHWEPVLSGPSRRTLERLDAAPAVLLDLGAGTGSLTLAAAERWPSTRVLALDASGAMLDVARSRVTGADDDRVSWLSEDAAHIPLHDASVDAVVSCGGGVVLDDASVALMRATGMVVHLEASPGVLVQRVGAGEGRPLLSGGVEDSLRRIHGERAVSYREAAHVVVDADADPETVAERVLEAWTRWS